MAPSKEHDNAVGEAPERPDYDALEREAQRLRTIIEQPTDAAAKLATIEQQLAARKEIEGRAAAKDRLVGIKRAVGSLMNTYGEDRQGVKDAVAALGEAIETLNARAEQIKSLHAEAAALADRFGVELPKLVVPREPETEIDVPLPNFWRHAVTMYVKEWDEHHLRERRTYDEVSGTEAHHIIASAGLKPWHPLTPEQQAAVAERAEDKRKERESAALFAREAAALLPEVPNVQQFVPMVK